LGKQAAGSGGHWLRRIAKRPAPLRDAADLLWPGLMRTAGSQLSGFLKRAPDFTAPF